MTSLLLAALAASTPVQSGVPADCSLTVSFGSYAMGIDQEAFRKTERLLKRDRNVRSTTSHRWGREGEVTLCAMTRRPAQARVLFNRVRGQIPRNPRGPVTIETRTGQRVTISKPPR